MLRRQQVAPTTNRFYRPSQTRVLQSLAPARASCGPRPPSALILLLPVTIILLYYYITILLYYITIFLLLIRYYYIATIITVTSEPPGSSAHRLGHGLPGYLIPFATHAFVPQRQDRPSRLPSPLAFL